MKALIRTKLLPLFRNTEETGVAKPVYTSLSNTARTLSLLSALSQFELDGSRRATIQTTGQRPDAPVPQSVILGLC
jgi:hypothetical protein